jgi:hypothetical protein
MTGHGAAPDGSGRRKIEIRIDTSWGVETNPAIWNGTVAAGNEWNGARDSNENSTGYYFSLKAQQHRTLSSDGGVLGVIHARKFPRLAHRT